MSNNEKAGLIAFVLAASIVAYIVIAVSYEFDKGFETYGLLMVAIKSAFALTDIGCIVAILTR